MSLYPSDLDYALAVDPEPDPERQAEEARETRWRDFVAFLRAEHQRRGSGLWTWGLLGSRVADALRQSIRPWVYWSYPGDQALHDAIVDFAGVEGWPAAISSLAIAMRDDEQARRELEARR